ncbi:MAG TPA: hypothetical protein VMS78_11975 [Rhizomicrobium sp.]|nr:hypothetical protein [Rhizomicrobium sp.]
MMKRTIIFLAAIFSATAALAADEFAIGPIKTGMTYDEVRAATPGAEWKPMPFRGIAAANAFQLGGLAFGAQYVPEPWDRYHIFASHASRLTDVASCRANYEKVTNVVQSSVGDLNAPPEFDPSEIGYAAKQSEVKIGDGTALLIQHVDNAKPESEWPFELSAVVHEGDTTINMSGEVHPAMGDKPAQCIVRVTLGEYTKRPRKGTVAFNDLVFTAEPSLSRLHHSLDNVAPPAAPITVALDCTIDDNDGHLENCKPDSANDPTAQSYAGVALARANDYRVADKTSSGKWTPGESTTLQIHIAAGDRHDDARVSIAKQSLLKFTAYPRPEEMIRFYPQDALAAGASTEIEVGCVIQTDFSAICPEISVPSGPFQAQFRAAASNIVTVYRVAPTLSDGSSAVGAGFRAKLKLSP